MTNESSVTGVPTDRDFVITRKINAPRALVFQAWTDPRHLSQWWGPSGFTTPVCELDLRVGGAHRIVMRSADGVDYPIKGVFIEIVKPERLVMTMDLSEHPAQWHDLVKPDRLKGDDNPAGLLIQTVTFEDLDGKTNLTVRTRFDSVAIRDAMLKIGMNEGWSQSLDRLEQLIAQISEPTAPAHINQSERSITSETFSLSVERRFNESAERVFDAWLEPKNVGKWLFATPDGQMVRVEIDARPGGEFMVAERRGVIIAEHFGNYLVIDRPHKLVFTFNTDRNSNPSLVSIEITSVPGGCELTLVHNMDPKWSEYSDRIRSGWAGILNGLSETLSTTAKS